MNYLRGVKHLIPISLRIIHFIFLFLKLGKGKGSPSNDLIRIWSLPKCIVSLMDNP